MPAPETSVGAIVINDGALLLIRRGRGAATGRWSVPGGRVEFGEPMASAVEREVAEETGLIVACGDHVGYVELIAPDHHYVIHDFLAELRGPSGPLVAGDDAAEAAWVPLAEVRKADLVDGMEAFLDEHGLLPPRPAGD
ncbi:MAG: NUDIX domain-containing protein [Actinomycetota bacterium]